MNDEQIIKNLKIAQASFLIDSDERKAIFKGIAAIKSRQWINVNSDLPVKQTQVMVWISGEDMIATAHIAVWSNGDKQWVFSLNQLDGCEEYITHWQPLPESPSS